MASLTDNIQSNTRQGLDFEANGHDIITSSFSPVSGRTYYKMRVVVACGDITYTDRGGTEHANAALPVVGDEVWISGAAPTIVGAGEVRASIDTP